MEKSAGDASRFPFQNHGSRVYPDGFLNEEDGDEHSEQLPGDPRESTDERAGVEHGEKEQHECGPYPNPATNSQEVNWSTKGAS